MDKYLTCTNSYVKYRGKLVGILTSYLSEKIGENMSNLNLVQQIC